MNYDALIMHIRKVPFYRAWFLCCVRHRKVWRQARKLDRAACVLINEVGEFDLGWTLVHRAAPLWAEIYGYRE